MNSSDTYRRQLHNWTRREHKDAPQYEDKCNGREWTSTVAIGGTSQGTGVGNSKVAAQENAAKAAMGYLGLL